MEEVSGIKKYRLSPEEIEAMLQTNYGSDIRPIDQYLLQKQRKQRQQQATQALNILANENNAELAEELEGDELKKLEKLEEIEPQLLLNL